MDWGAIRSPILLSAMDRIATEIEQLREQIHLHNHRYYVLAEPTISDLEFDQMLKRLETLEQEHPELITPDSPTQRVGSDLSEGFATVPHRYPMLSLSNTYSYAEVEDFYRRVTEDIGEEVDLVAELKYDGLSISLIYEDGVFTRAITRGDGTLGDDVTANVRTIRSIPLRLQGQGYPRELEVRGEILLPWKEFDRINQERLANGEAPFANPRNAASGTLKQLNPQIVADRRLDAYLYYVPGQPDMPMSHIQRLEICKQWGLKISPATRLCHTLSEVLSFLDYWDAARAEEPVATDGVVIKVDSIIHQEELGYTAKSPRWAIAYKFKAEQVQSVLESVDFQVGRTGTITPVGNLSPVLISGTTVRRASLHNSDFIRSLDLHIGDTVCVEKGGEIIPKIVDVVEELRTDTASPVIFPTTCPACGTTLERIEGEAAYYCPARNTCPPQQRAKVEHYCSRKAADIRIGPETIDLLFEHQMISNVADLYRISLGQLMGLPGFQRKSAENLLQSIEESKRASYPKILFGLGIRYVGETVAKTLCKAYPSISTLSQATVEELCAVPEIGPSIAKSVVAFFADDTSRTLVERLQEVGVTLSQEIALEGTNTDSPISGKTLVISGTFSYHSRDEYKGMVERLGGKMASSISAKTDYVLAGDKMGPAKLAKATSLGITILDETSFLSLIGEEKNNTLF